MHELKDASANTCGPQDSLLSRPVRGRTCRTKEP